MDDFLADQRAKSAKIAKTSESAARAAAVYAATSSKGISTGFMSATASSAGILPSLKSPLFGQPKAESPALATLPSFKRRTPLPSSDRPNKAKVEISNTTSSDDSEDEKADLRKERTSSKKEVKDEVKAEVKSEVKSEVKVDV
jgi:hypothetical protein